MMRTVCVLVLATVALLAAGSRLQPVDQKNGKVDMNHLAEENARASAAKVETRIETTEFPLIPSLQPKPVDCADHLLMGSTTSGVYEIYPFSCSCREPVRVWCDMETDGGGWTVFLARQRQTPQVDFNRSWTEYKEGFGDPTGEFWLGNEMLHRITSSRKYSLRVDLTLTNQIQQFAEWEEFRLGSETDKYRMNLENYLSLSTTYSNCLNIDNRYFTTYDRDYDYSSGNCAASIGGGWWTYNCRYMHLTAVYNQSLNVTCTGTRLQISSAQMKVRPSICSETLRTITLNNHQCGTCI
ncbi:ryncolin-1-like [Penaeus japonicus]|uniref:ryncolin-1-like n=1 Tax=Penaeus japonicus TaxID=27405 RepID=UPI001C714BCC|nr:ryncolin-1-like [Penaeus japonicus]